VTESKVHQSLGLEIFKLFRSPVEIVVLGNKFKEAFCNFIIRSVLCNEFV